MGVWQGKCELGEVRRGGCVVFWSEAEVGDESGARRCLWMWCGVCVGSRVVGGGCSRACVPVGGRQCCSCAGRKGVHGCVRCVDVVLDRRQ